MLDTVVQSGDANKHIGEVCTCYTGHSALEVGSVTMLVICICVEMAARRQNKRNLTFEAPKADDRLCFQCGFGARYNTVTQTAGQEEGAGSEITDASSEHTKQREQPMLANVVGRTPVRY